MDVRQIIQEEIQTLFGHPVPKKGERNYVPALHDLETVFMRASELSGEVKKYKDFLWKLERIMVGPANSAKNRLELIQDLVNSFNP